MNRFHSHSYILLLCGTVNVLLNETVSGDPLLQTSFISERFASYFIVLSLNQRDVNRINDSTRFYF